MMICCEILLQVPYALEPNYSAINNEKNFKEKHIALKSSRTETYTCINITIRHYSHFQCQLRHENLTWFVLPSSYAI